MIVTLLVRAWQVSYFAPRRIEIVRQGAVRHWSNREQGSGIFYEKRLRTSKHRDGSHVDRIIRMSLRSPVWRPATLNP